MKLALDYSKELRRKLADGRTLDEALAELRTTGASIFDCIVSVRTFRRCDIAKAKQIVKCSVAWSDYRDVTEEFVRELSKTDDSGMA